MKLPNILLFPCVFMLVACVHADVNSSMLWPVNTQDKVAYIDMNGAVQFHIRDAEGSIFYDGHATIEKDGKFGVIDRLGSFRIELEYSSIDRIDKNRYLASKQNADGKFRWFIIIVQEDNVILNLDADGVKAYLPSGDPAYLYVWRDSDFVLLDIGEMSLGFKGRLSFLYRSKDGIAPGINSDGKACFVDFAKQEIQIVENVSKVFSYSDNLFSAMTQQKKWGFIDQYGKWIVPPKYYGVKEVSNNRIAVQLSPSPPRWTYLDGKGADVAGFYADVGNFVNGLAPVAVSIGGEEKWGYVDLDGKFVVEAQYDYASEFIGELAQVILDDKIHYLNCEGRVVFVETDGEKKR